MRGAWRGHRGLRMQNKTQHGGNVRFVKGVNAAVQKGCTQAQRGHGAEHTVSGHRGSSNTTRRPDLASSLRHWSTQTLGLE